MFEKPKEGSEAIRVRPDIFGKGPDEIKCDGLIFRPGPGENCSCRFEYTTYQLNLFLALLDVSVVDTDRIDPHKKAGPVELGIVSHPLPAYMMKRPLQILRHWKGMIVDENALCDFGVAPDV